MRQRFAKIFALWALFLLASCGGGLDGEPDGVRKPLAAAPAPAAAAYNRDDIYRFFVVAFGAAPGVTYMGQAVAAADGGASIRQIVNAFSTKSQFLDTYPASLSDLAFAQKLTENVVGTSATADAKDEAIKDIFDALKLPGMTRGDIVYVIFNNLATKLDTDPKWGRTAIKLQNQVAFAKFYTDILGGSTNNLSILRSVVSTVTEVSRSDAMSIHSAIRPNAAIAETLRPADSVETIVWIETENTVELPPNPFGAIVGRGSFEVVDLFGKGAKSLFIPSGREFNTARSESDVDQISFSISENRIVIDPIVIKPKYVAGFPTSAVRGNFGYGKDSIIWADQGREVKDSVNHTDGSYLWRMDKSGEGWKVTEFAKQLGRQFWHSTNNAIDINGDGILDFVASTLFSTDSADRLGAVVFTSNAAKAEHDPLIIGPSLCKETGDVIVQSGTSALIRMSKGHAAAISLPYAVTAGTSAASMATIAELSADGKKVTKIQCIRVRGIELTKSLLVSEGFNSIKVLDLNGDGIDDFIAMAEGRTKGKKLLAFIQNSDGVFRIANAELGIPFEYALPNQNDADQFYDNVNNELIVGDLNGDGKVDITMAIKGILRDKILKEGLTAGIARDGEGFKVLNIPNSKIVWNSEYQTFAYDLIVPLDINDDGIMDFALFGVHGDKKYVTASNPYGVYTRASFLVSRRVKR